jgi:hypothetical protein
MAGNVVFHFLNATLCNNLRLRCYAPQNIHHPQIRFYKSFVSRTVFSELRGIEDLAVPEISTLGRL